MYVFYQSPANLMIALKDWFELAMQLTNCWPVIYWHSKILESSRKSDDGWPNKLDWDSLNI